ncbi:hypothetical protein CPAR01_09893 [Colletotrichum paranaense]|uniref:Uncharacterized protein n=1 Tax=Colletotrichum paranaense TaxID=1914294 RepID=A0ABQ9SCJ1_9PEZI|nr:uncharacterized protein CPAR01_09893 [Colletotrichum paranaense]KAK1533185.1 hypothetical protein CPAR01_09893 [Colletotrichum paranaense]
MNDSRTRTNLCDTRRDVVSRRNRRITTLCVHCMRVLHSFICTVSGNELLHVIYQPCIISSPRLLVSIYRLSNYSGYSEASETLQQSTLRAMRLKMEAMTPLAAIQAFNVRQARLDSLCTLPTASLRTNTYQAVLPIRPLTLAQSHRSNSRPPPHAYISPH